MASIPSSPRHSISNVKDLQNLFENPLISYASPSATPPPLQYFNMRVTERLHRYRSLKRQWQEVATAAQHDSPLSSKSVSPLPNLDITPVTQEQTVETKLCDFKDYINSIKTKENNSIELDPLLSRIQTDLIKLRRLIKARQKKFSETISFKANTINKSSGETTSGGGTTFDDSDNNHTASIRKSSSLSRARPLERVKISGCQMRPSTFPESNSVVNNGIVPTSNSSSTCSHYSKQQKSKQQNNNKTFNIYRSRVNPPLPPDSLIQGIPPAKKKPITSSKTIQNTNIKQTLSYRLPMPPILKKKQSSFIKQEPLLPPIQPLTISEQATTCLYTYAASSSSATPRYMKLNRHTSLLPILLTSSSCVGIQSEEETQLEDSDIDHRNLHDYKQLINRLPKPLISIIPRYGQDDYGMLYEQLDHIRETMPDCNVYDNYRRVC